MDKKKIIEIFKQVFENWLKVSSEMGMTDKEILESIEETWNDFRRRRDI